MTIEYNIRFADKTRVIEVPTVGKWYCAVIDESGFPDCGALGQYVGNGEFYDGDVEVTQAMNDCDYLQEQM